MCACIPFFGGGGAVFKCLMILKKIINYKCLTLNLNYEKPAFNHIPFVFSFSCAQEITMFDESFTYKFYQDEEKISYKDLGELMLKDSLTKLHWKKAKTKNIIVNLLLTAQVISFITIISSKENSDLPQILGPFIVVSSLVNIGILFTCQKSIRKAILRYNSLLDEP
jgi:hypothetical protein